MMSETVVTVQDGSNAPRQGPTVKTEPGQTSIIGGITLNVPYFRSIPGIVKLVQLGLGIICMACASPAWNGAASWFLFVATTSFIATLLWCFVYFLSIREALKVPINWLLTELYNTAIVTILYTIAFIVQIAVWSSLYGYPTRGANITAGVFGILNTLAYAAGTYFLYIEWKSSNSQ